MTWEPLSVRRGLKPPTALQGGVPAHLLPHVLGWISKSLGGESNAGAMARRANISYVALLNHIQVRDSGDSLDALNTILLQCRLDQDLCLDVLDCLLRSSWATRRTWTYCWPWGHPPGRWPPTGAA